MKARTLIIGAGIGGLTAALALRRVGFDREIQSARNVGRDLAGSRHRILRWSLRWSTLCKSIIINLKDGKNRLKALHTTTPILVD
jgi:glycine/D-amino acid oxidase-like deaminating enzyme